MNGDRPVEHISIVFRKLLYVCARTRYGLHRCANIPDMDPRVERAARNEVGDDIVPVDVRDCAVVGALERSFNGRPTGEVEVPARGGHGVGKKLVLLLLLGVLVRGGGAE